MAKFLPIEQQLSKQGFSFIAGIDEAGRGPLAGPVVSAAVILKKTAELPGLNDSKQLSHKKRCELFELVIENCLDFAISFVPSEIVDEINILQATIFANHLCIKNLKTQPDIAVIDGRDKQILEIPFLPIISGDQKVKSIAAASILAKVARDHLMTQYDKIYPEYGFSQHMGYGTRLHRANILKFGLCEIHRKSYKISQPTLFS